LAKGGREVCRVRELLAFGKPLKNLASHPADLMQALASASAPSDEAERRETAAEERGP
jgi:hypothetical protein